MYQEQLGRSEISLDVVDRWLIRACEALLSTWDAEAGSFWRDSWEEASDTSEKPADMPPALGRGKGATSNNRALQALVAAALCFSENEHLIQRSDVPTRVRAIVESMVTGYLCHPLASLRDHGENQQNPYTDAQLLLSLALALSPVTGRTCGFKLDQATEGTLRSHLAELFTDVTGDLNSEGVKVHTAARSHHFLTLHTVRSLDAAGRVLDHGRTSKRRRSTTIEQSDDFGQILTSVRDEIIQQLGLHLLPAPGFDSSSLVSCCALLARFTGDADSPLLQEAVNALVEDQSERGTWTSAGSLTFGRRRVVYIPSVELSLVLANLTLLDLGQSDTDLLDRALPALDSSLRLVQSSYSRHESRSGWRNDRTRSGQEVESWTTAVVIQFLLSYREALVLSRQEAILRKYRAARQPADFTYYWPDLSRLVPDEPRQKVLSTGRLPRGRLESFSAIVDPTEDNRIVAGVQREILEPVLTSTNERPDKTVSFLLYGPPGTRKTSFVENMADELRWPLITLSPPVFLRHGIEGFEASADEVFEDLFHLRRAVVLFDECEDFFRWRPTETEIGTRTIGAFMTSGMLPRLQRLRKSRWIIFVINTNVEAFELDDAVTRRGRLDKAERVGHPILEAQLRYVRQWRSRATDQALGKQALRWFETHLTQIEREMKPERDRLQAERDLAQREHPDRGDEYRARMSELQQESAAKLTKVVTFGLLDDLVERCLGEGTESRISTSKSLGDNLQQEFQRFGPDRFASTSPSTPT